MPSAVTCLSNDKLVVSWNPSTRTASDVASFHERQGRTSASQIVPGSYPHQLSFQNWVWADFYQLSSARWLWQFSMLVLADCTSSGWQWMYSWLSSANACCTESQCPPVLTWTEWSTCSGPRTDPSSTWIIHDHTVYVGVLFVKYDVNHARQLPSMLTHCCRRDGSRLWSTVSNAADGERTIDWVIH